MPNVEECRCGRKTETEHKCHGMGYTCPREGAERLYGLHISSLAGAQMKFGAYETFACDECWETYMKGQSGE